MTIDDIIEYRKNKIGKCLSTRHDMSYSDFSKMLPQLRKTFKWFDIEISPKIVRITISASKYRKK